LAGRARSAGVRAAGHHHPIQRRVRAARAAGRRAGDRRPARRPGTLRRTRADARPRLPLDRVAGGPADRHPLDLRAPLPGPARRVRRGADDQARGVTVLGRARLLPSRATKMARQEPRPPRHPVPPMPVAVLLLFAASLVGAVPFGYLVGRLRGVDLFQAGSGNIGATNAARVLGRTYGALVFALDFLKGVVPVAVVVPLARLIEPGAETALGPPDALRVRPAALAFLAHLFPIYLGFRGGKGVAPAAGAVLRLGSGPARPPARP